HTTLSERAPTVVFTVPRYPPKFASQVLLGIHNSSGLKRASASVAMRFARQHARRRWSGESGFAHAALYRACRVGVFAPILNKLGLDRRELAVCARAPLAVGTSARLRTRGVKVAAGGVQH